MLKSKITSLKVIPMFSDYLKTKRRAAGLSQQRLADKITGLGYAISNGAISYYETGYGKKKGWSNRPPEEFIKYLSVALGLDENEARSEAGYASEPSENADTTPEPIRSALRDAVNLTDFDVEMIARFIQFLDFLRRENHSIRGQLVGAVVEGIIRADENEQGKDKERRRVA